MEPAANVKPTWPLGWSFIDHEGRKFDIVKTVFGNPDADQQNIVECENGWTIQSEWGEHIQTQVGFTEQGKNELIIQPCAEMDRHMANGYLKWI